MDAVKKVIANMTVGKDVSSLFTDVINCIQVSPPPDSSSQARSHGVPRAPPPTTPLSPPQIHRGYTAAPSAICTLC
jgi:hypothetical protein